MKFEQEFFLKRDLTGLFLLSIFNFYENLFKFEVEFILINLKGEYTPYFYYYNLDKTLSFLTFVFYVGEVLSC